MNKLILLSIIQALYIIFILNFFKTKYSFAHPLSNFSSDYFRHPIGVNNESISNICEFGHQSSWFLAIFIIIRSIFITKFTRFMDSQNN